MTVELINAVKMGNVEQLEEILSAGSGVNSCDENGATLLMIAAHEGNLLSVKLLLEKGADVNLGDEQGWTPLMKSVYNFDMQHGHPDVMQVLIDAGANIEAPIGYGVRPLMLAAGYGETTLVEVLLEAGAEVTAKNEGGLTALMMVKQKHYIDVINLLHQAEQLAGVGEGSCSTKHAPGSNVETFLKPDSAS